MILYEIFLINSLVIFGVFASTGRGMIFGFLQPKLKEVDKWAYLRKPLYDCPTCMASVWGTAGFFFTGLPLLYLPVYVLALAGFNYMIVRLMTKESD